MSQARIYTTKGPVRKDGLKCGKCGTEIKKGVDRRRTFAVGFRGREQTRCMDPKCTPTRSERESSAVGSVYDAVDGVDLSSIDTLDGFTEVKDDIVAAMQEVIDDYENNEMFEINYDLQERVDTLQNALDELENWEPEDEEPEDEADCDECGGSGQVTDDHTQEDVDCEDCGATGSVDNADAKGEWVETTRESLQQAIDEMELP